MIKKVTPFFMYDHSLDEVLDFYASVFKDFKVISSQQGPDGKIAMATFEVGGQEICRYNDGPHFKFTEAAFNQE